MIEKDRSIREVDEPLSDEDFAKMAEVLMNPDAALKTLPIEEKELYREAQQSVVDARSRAGALTMEEIQRGYPNVI